MKCLLIETKDKKRFFTTEENLPQLIEFSKTFNAEISTVNLESGDVLQLEELVPAICNPPKKKSRPKYEILETMIPAKRRDRSNIIKNAWKIQNYIMNEFRKEGILEMKDLKEKFKKHELTDACLRNHIYLCRDKLAEQGYKVVKTGLGQYKLL